MKILSQGTVVLMFSSLISMPCWAATNPVYDAPVKPIKAIVKILALSSVGRQAYAGNQDTYIAEIDSTRGNRRLVKLVDRYPVYGDPIRHSILADRRVLRMRLVREESCDVLASYVLTPGDENIFDDHLSAVLEENGPKTIPCFSVDHAATRLAK